MRISLQKTQPSTKQCLVLLLLLAMTSMASAENIMFPPDAGVVDVAQPPYNAKGDGMTDDTAAIQRALNDYAGRGIIYLPNGTYRVSDTLAWAGRCTRTILQGQSEAGTTIRLADRAPGFGDPTKPKPVVYTGTFPPQRFRNAIRNLTIDTGAGNAGAIGCRFNASNQGDMMHVTIRSGDGHGPIGLDMGYVSDVGPLFIKNLRVFGFDVGIYTAYGVAGQAMEHITVANQNFCGWVNDGQAVSVRGFTSSNQVPALWNKDLGGHLVLLDAQLTGDGPAAILNDASLYARNIQATGYEQAIGGLRGTKGTRVEEFVSHPVQSLFPSPTRALRLPVEETPTVPWDEPKDWVSIRRFEPKVVTITKEKKGKPVTEKITDWTEAIQRAIDSGATTVYFPRGGDYEVVGTIHMRGKVRRLIGMEGALGRQGHGTFQLDDGAAPVVVMERFDWIYSPITVRTASKRTLVVSAVAGGKFEIGPGGKAFFEDVVNLVRLGKDARVWIRQFNTEYTDEETAEWFPNLDRWARPGNLNEGGRLWVLGLKTEGDGTLITTRAGGQTEVLGGVVYANKNFHPDKKMFVVEDSALTASIREFVSRNQPFHPVVETRNGVTNTMPVTPGGCLLSLCNGYQPKPGEPVTEPGQSPATVPLAPEGKGTGLRMETAGNITRWTGQIEARTSGWHQFQLDTNGARLMIAGRVVADAWSKGVRYRFGRVWLEAGNRYNVKLEATAPVTWRWAPPGQKPEPVPTSQLYATTASMPTVTMTSSATKVTEGGTATLTITRTGDTAKPLTVHLAPRVNLRPLLAIQWAERGNTVAGLDYEPVPEIITLPAGQASATIPFVTRDDRKMQPERRAVFALDFRPEYHVAGNAEITIEDNDQPPPGSGTGLKAEYFDDLELKRPVGTRVDNQINFTWDKAVPYPGITPEKKPKSGYSARWAGQVVPQFSENYRFELAMSKYGGARLWVDGQLLVDAWEEKGLCTGTMALVAGRKYDLKLEFSHRNFYDGRIKLLWSSPSQFEEIVPQAQLYPAP